MTIYTNIHLGHNHNFNDLRESRQDWLTSANHGLYYKMLQVEDSSEVGWLLYSTREMDAGALADEIADMIGIKVGLRWKIISNGTRNNSDKTKVQALCIEVPAKEKWQCQKLLLRLYSRTIKAVNEYPNGIRMRFVKLKKDAINMKEKSKLDKLRERQRRFLAGICSLVNYDVCQLDYSSDEGVIPTLRQMIMSITSRNNGITPLFHCVDMDWLQEGFTFQFSPDVKEEAETVVNTLLPHLLHFFPGSKVEDSFTEETYARCEHMEWSEELNMIIDNTMGNDTDNIEEEENLIGFTFNATTVQAIETQEDNLPTRPSRTAKNTMPRDNDLVSTLGGPFSRGLTSPTGTQSKSATGYLGGSSNSVTSNSSVITMEQYNELQQSVARVSEASTSQFNAINDRISQILDSISVITSVHQPGSAGTDSSSPGETAEGSSGHKQ